MSKDLGKGVSVTGAGQASEVHEREWRIHENHYGEKEAKFTTGGRGPVMSLGFQVSDVQKPLAAVWRVRPESRGQLHPERHHQAQDPHDQERRILCD